MTERQTSFGRFSVRPVWTLFDGGETTGEFGETPEMAAYDEPSYFAVYDDEYVKPEDYCVQDEIETLDEACALAARLDGMDRGLRA